MRALFMFSGLLVALSAAQAAFSPPAARDHTRLPQIVPAGRRETVLVGKLFIPQKLVRKKRLPLVVHFHGAALVAETAAANDGRCAVISVESGEGAEVYARLFSDHALFGKIVDEASRKTGIRFAPIVLSAWSA